MNEQQAAALMRRVSSAYGRGFRTETTTEWQHQLGSIDADAANQALDRIIQTGEPGPSVARIIAEVIAARPRHNHTAPVGNYECEHCFGDGFIYDASKRLTPCPTCRPEHPLNSTRLRAV